jgi:YD repeat-containing protein
MKMSKITIASLLILLSIHAFGQDAGGKNSKYAVPKVEDLVKVPPSPEAQAFAKYGNTPANIYSGTPSVSIPIGNLNGREIQVPVSLNYDASGVKVEQTATSVGLGWSLNAGGMVTRQVNGLPDDYIGATISYLPFYHSTVKSDYEFVRDFTATPNNGEGNGASIYPPGQLTRYFSFMYEVTKPTGLKYEIQPDTYSFNALGISGTLYIDYTNNTAYCIEAPEIKATPIFQTMGYSQVITGWEIIDATGTTYTFAEGEKTWVYDEDGADGQRSYYSAWVLTSVATKNNRDRVVFNYNTLAPWEQPQLAGRAITRNDFPTSDAPNWYPCGVDEMLISVSPTYKIAQKELSSISINNKTRADFFMGAARLDLAGKNTLNQILIYGEMGNLLNMYKLNQSYFGAPSTVEKMLRLRLDNVEIYAGSTSTIPPQKYVFTYNSLELPSRESMAQDFWGYYNGMNENTTLIPFNYDLDYGSLDFVGANRFPSFTHTQAGSLTKIQYPTGGTSEFYYQPHALPSTTYSSSFDQEYQLGGAGLVGGADETDPMSYLRSHCDDKTTISPRGVETSFYVPPAVATTHPYRLKLDIANSNPNDNPNNHMHFVAIYYAGIDGKQLRTFCDLYNNGGAIYFKYEGYTQGSTLDQPITLQEGYYRIMILNTIPSTNISVRIMGTKTITSTVTQANGAGLRIFNIKDKDTDQSIVSDRYFYYGDLRTVPPASITTGFIQSSAMQTIGTLHAEINFEEAKSFEKMADEEYQMSTQVCSSIHRYGSNRIQSNHFITYPVVSEISFDRQGNNNGYTITRFYDNVDNYSGGFSKKNLLNGKIRQKWIYNKNGELLQQERNYVSQVTVAPGTVGFYFASNKSTLKDVTVKTFYNVPNEEFYSLDDPLYTRPFGGGGWSITHCVSTGIVGRVFGDRGYHEWWDTHTKGACSDTESQVFWNPFNNNHPARQLFFQYQIQGIPDVTANHHGNDGLVAIFRRVYNIIHCRHFGQDYKKQQYLFSRWWVKQDSSVAVTYSQSDSLIKYTRNLYENTSHYQITRTRTKGSDGVVRTARIYYPSEMRAANHSQPIWSDLIAANRIAEPIKIESTYGNNSPDFVQHTDYRTFTSGTNTMIVPDRMRFSSGANPLEDRIRYHQYDEFGNPIEISREGDTRVSFIWGYNGQMLIAEVKNASSNEIFHTSFEEQGGNSTVDDSRTGRYSSTTGFSKLLTGLTPNKAYVLTYWQKLSGVWTLQTTLIPPSSATTYQITLSNQVDEIRFAPQNAMMSTFTHRPGAGILSSTDPNNRSVFYEYDPFNRLRLIKDNDRQILKTFQYNYKQ